MEGSADDFAAPDSWEIADLDVAVTRLMLSSKKNPTDPSESAGDPTASTASSSSAAASSSPEMVSADRAGGSSEDASNQVDQFLREALQNPRERLSSKDICFIDSVNFCLMWSWLGLMLGF